MTELDYLIADIQYVSEEYSKSFDKCIDIIYFNSEDYSKFLQYYYLSIDYNNFLGKQNLGIHTRPGTIKIDFNTLSLSSEPLYTKDRLTLDQLFNVIGKRKFNKNFNDKLENILND